jgi:hypothetical protein
VIAVMYADAGRSTMKSELSPPMALGNAAKAELRLVV